VWIAKEDLTDFTEKVVRMLKDTEARKSLGDSGRDYAHGWSASKQAERMLTFYQSVLDAATDTQVNLKNIEVVSS
jgi:hypothetical protein